MKNIIWVTPAEMFANWSDLSEKDKIAVEEDQYRQQLYSKHYGD